MNKCIRENHTKMCGIIVAGSLFSFLLSMLFATVVFNQTFTNTSSSNPEIEMVMQMLPLDNRVEVWMDSIVPLHVIVEISNISKRDGDCQHPTKGSFSDLIPISGPVCGSGTMVMKIAVVDSNEMPDLNELSHDVVPLAYIREETVERIGPLVKFAAVALRRLKLINWTFVLTGIALVLMGGRRVYLQRKNGNS